MKTSKQLLLYGLVFAFLLGTAYMFQVTAPQQQTANVEFDPDTMDLEAPGWTVKTVLVTVWFDKGRFDGRDIDPKTILIEGILEPKGGWKHTWTERIRIGDGRKRAVWWVFRFNVSGSSMRELLWSMISHMNPGSSLLIPLEVTGQLYNEDAFSATFTMTVFVSNPPPPQPLP